MPFPFERLDFVYAPSADVEGDLRYFTDVIGGRPVFSVAGMGTRVAMVDLTGSPPYLLLAGHLRGERPVLVYRVPDLQGSLDALEARGWEREASFEIPHGPICSFRTPGGHRIALYQLTRPGATEHFEGRFDP